MKIFSSSFIVTEDTFVDVVDDGVLEAFDALLLTDLASEGWLGWLFDDAANPFSMRTSEMLVCCLRFDVVSKSSTWCILLSSTTHKINSKSNKNLLLKGNQL